MDYNQDSNRINIVIVKKNNNKYFAYSIPKKYVSENNYGQIVLNQTKNYSLYSSGYYERLSDQNYSDLEKLDDDSSFIIDYLNEITGRQRTHNTEE